MFDLLVKFQSLNVLPNGATGKGGAYAFKHGYEGAWSEECDIGGLGFAHLDPCGDDNNLLGPNGLLKVPYNHGGFGGFPADPSDYY